MTSCNHDLESPGKTLKATLAPRWGWRCTVCGGEWYPEVPEAATEITMAIERLIWAREELAEAIETGEACVVDYCSRVFKRRELKYRELMIHPATCYTPDDGSRNARPRSR